jgi:hypothetical protein
MTQSAFPAVSALVASNKNRFGVVVLDKAAGVVLVVVLVSLSPVQEKISSDKAKVLSMVLIRFIGFYVFRFYKLENQMYYFF